MPTAKIERGLGTERARLGRGWLVATRLGRTVAKAKIERGLGTERARLGTLGGFGTKRARLGTFHQNFEIYTQNEPLPVQRFFFLSFGRKSKNRPTCCNFEKKKS